MLSGTMDKLISSFGASSLGGGVQKLEGELQVYISEGNSFIYNSSISLLTNNIEI